MFLEHLDMNFDTFIWLLNRFNALIFHRNKKVNFAPPHFPYFCPWGFPWRFCVAGVLLDATVQVEEMRDIKHWNVSAVAGVHIENWCRSCCTCTAPRRPNFLSHAPRESGAVELAQLVFWPRVVTRQQFQAWADSETGGGIHHSRVN